MKAMIMAAGFGTRLKPLTDKIPKALVPVVNRPVLERGIEYLAGFGIRDIVINAHYHMEIMENYVRGCKIPGVNLTVSREPEILGTGGGLLKCRDFLKDGTFIVINSDILTDIDLDQAVKSHTSSGAIATMVLHHCPRFGLVAVKNNRVEALYKDPAPGRFAFTGIHLLSPEVFDYLPPEGYADIISLCYKPMIESGITLNAHTVTGHYWHDIGTIEDYINANLDFLGFYGKKIVQGEDTSIDPTATVKNWAIIGNNVTIEKGAVIDSSIIWDNAVIKKGSHLKDSIAISEDMIIQTVSMPEGPYGSPSDRD